VGISKIVTTAKPLRSAGEPNSKNIWILNVYKERNNHSKDKVVFMECRGYQSMKYDKLRSTKKESVCNTVSFLA